jgi:hypothetical protein
LLGNADGKQRLLREKTAIDRPSSTNPSQTADSAMGKLNGVAPATSESFLLQNATAQVLRADMSLGTPYVLLSESDSMWMARRPAISTRALCRDSAG